MFWNYRKWRIPTIKRKRCSKELMFKWKPGKCMRFSVRLGAVRQRCSLYWVDIPTSGKILFNGTDIEQTGLGRHRKKHVSFIFQSYNLIDYMTPQENVRLTAKKPALPFLERLGLTKEESKRNVLQLSGGQQQRVAIARALASEAPVILADEPTGNLDEDTAQDITEILKESAHEQGKCVIVVTHSGELAKQADVVFRLKKGTLTVEGL